MFTILKPFLKYASILALLLVFFDIMVRLKQENMAFIFTLLIYFPILLLVAPILFGIWYGHRLSQNHILSFKDNLKISFIILTLSYITYLIPFYEWILRSDVMLIRLLPHTLFPAVLLTISFFCSSIITQSRNRKRLSHH